MGGVCVCVCMYCEGRVVVGCMCMLEWRMGVNEVFVEVTGYGWVGE